MRQIKKARRDKKEPYFIFCNNCHFRIDTRKISRSDTSSRTYYYSDAYKEEYKYIETEDDETVLDENLEAIEYEDEFLEYFTTSPEIILEDGDTIIVDNTYLELDLPPIDNEIRNYIIDYFYGVKDNSVSYEINSNCPFCGATWR